jgi:hypothetical protein
VGFGLLQNVSMRIVVCRFKAFAHATIRGDETSKALQLFWRRALFLFAAASFPPSDKGKAARQKLGDTPLLFCDRFNSQFMNWNLLPASTKVLHGDGVKFRSWQMARRSIKYVLICGVGGRCSRIL